MTFSKTVLAALSVCLGITASAASGESASVSTDSVPIRVVSSMATRPVLVTLLSQFEKESGYTVELESVGGVTAARRVEAGEAFDLVILASGALEALTESGKIARDSRVDFVRSGVAVAVRKGERTFDISTEEAVKQAVLNARNISYSTGPSGTYLSDLFKRWGIDETIKDRIVQPAPGIPVGSLVAKGEVELGFQQFSELLHVEGIVVLGPLPAEIQTMTVFSAAMTTTTPQRNAVDQLLKFLTSPATAGVKRENGMEPPL